MTPEEIAEKLLDIVNDGESSRIEMIKAMVGCLAPCLDPPPYPERPVWPDKPNAIRVRRCKELKWAVPFDDGYESGWTIDGVPFRNLEELTSGWELVEESE